MSFRSKEEMWAVYDVFRFFTGGMQFKIERAVFLKRLKDCITRRQKWVVNKARLTERFRESAQDVTLEEFVKMYWPRTSPSQMNTLIQWCHLREAQAVLKSGVEASDAKTLRRIFDLLDANQDHRVSVEELQQAEILTSEEVACLMSEAKKKHDALATKALAVVALFGKKMDECDYDELFSTGGLQWDGQFSFWDFCAIVNSREEKGLMI